VTTLSVSFLLSFALTTFLVRYAHLHDHITGDNDFNSPQKFHNKNVSRIGGLAIFFSIMIAGLVRYFFEDFGGREVFFLGVASIPAFFVGFAEDVTKQAGIKVRLIGTFFSAFVACYFFDCWITHTGFTWLDPIFYIPVISILFTAFAICGVANAYNIIDGFNGLASIVGIMSLIAISYVGFKVNDPIIFILGMVMIGATMGFFFWNYPKGKIFLGDGGAYLIGFWVSFLSVLLVARNSSVSPIFALVVNAYPTVETLFTVWRRVFHKQKNPSIADDMHLHSLIYRRVVRWEDQDKGNIVSISANARTSPYLWAIHTITIIPACMFWDSTLIMSSVLLIFIFLYIYSFKKIIQFKVPSWLK